MRFGLSDSDTLATPSPTVSISELSTSPSAPDGSSDEYTSIEEDDDEYGAGSDSDSDMDSEYAPSECGSPRPSPDTKRHASLPKNTRPAPSPSRRAKPSAMTWLAEPTEDEA